MPMERNIIFRKLDVNKLAVICGIVNNDINKTTPTKRMTRMMETAIKNIMIYPSEL